MTESIGSVQCLILALSIRLVETRPPDPIPQTAATWAQKNHILLDAHGIPLAEEVTAINVNDVVELIPLVAAVPAVGGKLGAPKSRPGRIQGNRGYHSESARRAPRWMGIKP